MAKRLDNLVVPSGYSIPLLSIKSNVAGDFCEQKVHRTRQKGPVPVLGKNEILHKKQRIKIVRLAIDNRNVKQQV